MSSTELSRRLPWIHSGVVGALQPAALAMALLVGPRAVSARRHGTSLQRRPHCTEPTRARGLSSQTGIELTNWNKQYQSFWLRRWLVVIKLSVLLFIRFFYNYSFLYIVTALNPKRPWTIVMKYVSSIKNILFSIKLTWAIM